jgi:hypothetical protein
MGQTTSVKACWRALALLQNTTDHRVNIGSFLPCRRLLRLVQAASLMPGANVDGGNDGANDR